MCVIGRCSHSLSKSEWMTTRSSPLSPRTSQKLGYPHHHRRRSRHSPSAEHANRNKRPPGAMIVQAESRNRRRRKKATPPYASRIHRRNRRTQRERKASPMTPLLRRVERNVAEGAGAEGDAAAVPIAPAVRMAQPAVLRRPRRRNGADLEAKGNGAGCHGKRAFQNLARSRRPCRAIPRGRLHVRARGAKPYRRSDPRL